MRYDDVLPMSLDGTVPARLAEMMTLDSTPPRLWSSEELGVILRHQLSVPLGFDLGEPLEEAAATADARPMFTSTFAELLRHRKPPLAMLERTKHFAKACKNDPRGPLPDEVATVLYYAALAVALLRCGERITSMDDAAIRRGFEWILLQSWVENDLQTIFRETLPLLTSDEC